MDFDKILASYENEDAKSHEADVFISNDIGSEPSDEAENIAETQERLVSNYDDSMDEEDPKKAKSSIDKESKLKGSIKLKDWYKFSSHGIGISGIISVILTATSAALLYVTISYYVGKLAKHADTESTAKYFWYFFI